MAASTLGAQKREGTGKGVARKLRQAGRIPAVLYGRELDAIHLSVDAHDAEQLFHSISVENTIVELSVDGEKEAYETLVREIQTHPFKGSLIHIDFLRIQAGVAVDVEVPVHLIGTPIGVKNSGGVIEQIIHEMPVKCIPSLIPESIEINVEELDIGDSLHVYDISLEEGVEITIEQKRTICSVAIPKVVEEVVEEEELLEGELPEGEEGAEAPEGAADADAEGESSDDGEADE